MRQTRRRTQTGLTPGKDDNDVWHKSGRKDIKWFYWIMVLVNSYDFACGESYDCAVRKL